MLTAVLSVVDPGSSAQNVLSILMALLYIKLYSFFSPYSNIDDNVLAETGQFQVFFTFFGALIMQSSLLGSSWNTFVGKDF